MNRLSTRLFSFFLFVSVLWLPAPVIAEWGPECQQNGVATIGGIGCILENILGGALRLIGLVAFMMIAFGAFRWLSSGGDAKALDGAKQTISMAILGLVIAAGAWFIFALLQSVTGLDLSNFSLNFTD
jgi:hypothetical protein